MFFGEQGEWLFKNGLSDGHYCSYEFNKRNVSVEVTIKNGIKEGIENRYFGFSNQKYATVNWKGGKKNGEEIYYNGHGTLNHLLTFRNDTLDGLCIINWSDGQKNYRGFYKNNYRDSIWTYYENWNGSLDSSDFKIAKQFRYRDGKRYLIGAWNKRGIQTVTHGNGFVEDSGYYSIKTDYLNGEKNGKEIAIRTDGILESEKFYENDLLIKEIDYDSVNKVSAISKWIYPYPPNVDTGKAWVDTYITKIYYNEIRFDNVPVRSGYWIAYFPNNVKIYEGNYASGKQTGIWNWYFPNGKQKVFADFNKNVWKHFNSTDELISEQPKEFFTLLTDGSWYLNGSLDSSTVTLTRKSRIDQWLEAEFHPIGEVDFYCWECLEREDYFDLSVDTLKISNTVDIVDKTIESIYWYKITSANTEELTMKRID